MQQDECPFGFDFQDNEQQFLNIDFNKKGQSPMRLRKYTQDEVLKDTDQLLVDRNDLIEQIISSSRRDYAMESKQPYEEDKNHS